MYPTLVKRLARVGLKSDVDMAIQMTVPVLRASAGNTYVFQFTVYVQPTGTDGSLGTKRLAQAGEVTCMVQYPWGLSNWTDFTGAVATDANGKATVTVQDTSMRFPSTYRAYALHIQSAAEVALTFSIASDGASPSGISAQSTVAGGKTLATFSQENMGDQAFRKMAFPETRNFPFAGLHQTRGRNISFPEVRQWVRTGPETYLPGQVIQVRQSPNNRRPTV